ncbi:MAG: prephenate dehydrogenase/arogenate dehydrogenase family protein [archaeon]|jgi:prephenate dehydrogenase
MKMLIIGGAGAFGSFYAKLFLRNDFEVSINDVSEAAAKKVCDEHKLNLVTDLKQAKEFDIVIVSVPNSDAPVVINKVSKIMKKDSLLIDLCSVKTPLEEELNKAAKLGLEVVSLHPMHGPRIGCISGQSIAIIKIGKGELAKQIINALEKEGAELFNTTIKEHDEILSIVQGLTHYSQFVCATTLKELEVDQKRTLHLASPNYTLLVSLISRVVLQNPEIYSEIQLSNPLNEKVRTAFIKSAKEIDEICSKNDKKLLAKKIVEIAQQFKEGEMLLVESDKAVASQTHTINTLKAKIGKRFLVENLATHSIHYGIIKSVEHNELTLIENTHETKISIHKIGLISKEDTIAWKEKNLLKKHLDFSFLVPKCADSKILLRTFSFVKEANFELIDEFCGNKLPEGKKSITVKATFFEDENKELISAKVKETISGFCFEIR